MKCIYAIIFTLFTSVTNAATFVEDFETGLANPNLHVTASPNFSVNYSGGKGDLVRTGGGGNGRLSLSTKFKVVGDFVTTVELDRSLLGTGSAGIRADDILYSGSLLQDIYFNPFNLVQGNIFASGLFTDKVISAGASSSAVLRLRRVGDTAFTEVDFGSGFTTVNSRTDANLSLPVTLSLFLFEEIGANDNLIGTFDNWTIEADFFVPEPSSLALVSLAILFCGRFSQRKTICSAS